MIAFLLAGAGCYFIGVMQPGVAGALIVAGGLIALIGFLDDHGHIAARWRLLTHIIAAIVALYCLGGVPPIYLDSLVLEPAALRNTFGVLYIVWLLNLYNFMDGIDGLAGVEGVTVCLGISLIYLGCGHGAMVWPPALLAGALGGFLVWNFPPAKIFMGDAGSGFLGFVLALLAVDSAYVNAEFFWAWSILLGVFVVDATFTLLRRLLSGLKIYEAHRTHAYQYAARQAGSHLPVTLAVAGINLFWLLPVACLVIFMGMPGIFGVLLAYAPLVFLAFRLGAGLRE